MSIKHCLGQEVLFSGQNLATDASPTELRGVGQCFLKIMQILKQTPNLKKSFWISTLKIVAASRRNPKTLKCKVFP